jgi:hypothetical protein
MPFLGRIIRAIFPVISAANSVNSSEKTASKKLSAKLFAKNAAEC